jgi:DNA recombination protein RmuC
MHSNLQMNELMEIATGGLAAIVVVLIGILIYGILNRRADASAHSLDTKKQLIDQQLEAMNRKLESVSTLMHDIEKDRESKFGELNAHLRTIGEQTASLSASTATLREALSSARVRGQWGQRMAEDILRMIGLIEGINFKKELPIEGSGSRPDFVFFLPGNLQMNMDVKFPFDNYVKFLEDSSDSDREQHRAAFLRDVRARVKEVTTREYINPEKGTVDYVLLFIPNESIYAFIHENDPGILDYALKSRVICCSPFTLFAVLAVVRQAVDNFALKKESDNILSFFGRFHTEWNNFSSDLNKLGKQLGSTQKTYEELVGPRKRKLESPLRRIEALRQQKNLPIAPADPSLANWDIEIEEKNLDNPES